MKKTILLIFLILIVSPLFAQENAEYRLVCVAFYNLENLFDRSSVTRPAELASTLRHELKGWTTAVRDRKLEQLASIYKRGLHLLL